METIKREPGIFYFADIEPFLIGNSRVKQILRVLDGVTVSYAEVILLMTMEWLHHPTTPLPLLKHQNNESNN